MPTLAPSTKVQIVLTAERLFAEHGIDGVSLRRIGAEAGAANNSAVQYHFTSRDDLIDTIFGYRLPWLHERRSLLIAERCPGDLRGYLECQALAILEQTEQVGSRYLGFIAMLLQQGRWEVFDHLPAEVRDSVRVFHERLDQFLADVPEPVRAYRIAQAMIFLVRVGADRERARSQKQDVLALAIEFTALVDSLVGLLQGPVSPTTLAVLDQSGSPTPSWRPFL